MILTDDDLRFLFSLSHFFYHTILIHTAPSFKSNRTPKRSLNGKMPGKTFIKSWTMRLPTTWKLWCCRLHENGKHCGRPASMSIPPNPARRSWMPRRKRPRRQIPKRVVQLALVLLLYSHRQKKEEAWPRMEQQLPPQPQPTMETVAPSR